MQAVSEQQLERQQSELRLLRNQLDKESLGTNVRGRIVFAQDVKGQPMFFSPNADMKSGTVR